jgi:hypothetical protein
MKTNTLTRSKPMLTQATTAWSRGYDHVNSIPGVPGSIEGWDD